MGLTFHHLFIATILLGLASCTSNEKSTYPKSLQLTESVYSSATIQPDSLYEVFSSVSGILDKLLITEGSIVKSDQPIALITNTLPQLNVDNAQVALAQAQLNARNNSSILSAIANEITTAELKANSDKINFERQEMLWQKSIGSKSDYDMRKLAYQTSKYQVDILKDKYTRTKNELNTALKQAQIQYQSALSNTKDFQIFSQIGGQVYSINKKQGEIINPQSPIATIGSHQNFLIEMLIDEVDITQLELGQQILLTLDAYEGQVFEARIHKIYPSKDERTQTFKVEGVFIVKPPKLYPGLSGEANIIIRTKPHVLAVPNNYLTANNEVKTANGLIPVKTGLKTLEYTEIINGIDSTTVIYKPE